MSNHDLLEAELLLVKNITHIAWIPSTKKKPDDSDKTLKGHFRVKVKANTGPGISTTDASI